MREQKEKFIFTDRKESCAMDEKVLIRVTETGEDNKKRRNIQ